MPRPDPLAPTSMSRLRDPVRVWPRFPRSMSRIGKVRNIILEEITPEEPTDMLTCPLCSTPLEASGLEAHLRFELRLPLLACSLCPVTFCAEAEADKHFTGTFAKHPGVQVQLISHPSDAAKEARLEELVRLARGGEEAVQQRLCVCGQCRLLCREDFRPPQHSGIRPADIRIKGSPGEEAQYSAEGLEQAREEDSPDPAFHFATDEDRVQGNVTSADQFPAAVLQKHLEEEEEDDDPEDHFSTGTGQLKPYRTMQPVPDDRWPMTAQSEANEQPDRGHHSRQNWQPSEEEATTLAEAFASPKPAPAQRKRSPKAKSISKRSAPKHIQKTSGAATAKELTCRSCNKVVRKKDAKEHASRFHLKKTLHQCKSCDFASTNSNVGNVNQHVKKAHGRAPGPEAVDSAGLAEHAEAIEAMIRTLFGV